MAGWDVSQWNFYIADLVSGDIVTDVEFASFQGDRHLIPGQMQATQSWFPLKPAERADMQEYTTPGKYSVVCERDNVIVGEWIIWSRSRANDFGGVTLGGAEVLSFLDQRVVHTFVATGWDQFEIADELTLGGFGSLNLPGAQLRVNRPTDLLSGVTRDRRYELAESTIGQRLRELSEVIDGFDYYIDSSWATSGARRRVERNLQYSYPRAGIDRGYLLSMGAPRQGIEGEGLAGGGNILALSVDEDAKQLAQRVYALGAGQGTGRVLGDRSSRALFDRGFPYMTTTRSWTSVTSQSVINKHADELLKVSQSSELPPTIILAADGDPAFGTYGLGDTMPLQIDPSVNFPTGYSDRIRVLGWSLVPPTSAVETIALQITSVGI